MIRIRLGDSWKHDPTCHQELLALAEDRGRGFSPRSIVDAIRIEVDGVDLTRGRAEASLVDSLVALRAAAAHTGRHTIRFGAGLTLNVHSTGDDLHLHLSSEHGDIHTTVDAAPFADAVRRSSTEFVEALRRIHPALEQQRLCDQLLERAPSPRKPRSPQVARPQIGRPRAGRGQPRTPAPRTLAQPPRRLPLPEDGLRRMLYRRAWRDTVAPGAELSAFGGGWLVQSPADVEARTVDGVRTWSAPLTSCLVEDGKDGRVIGLDSDRRAVALDTKGSPTFTSRVQVEGPLCGGLRLGQRGALLATRETLYALSPEGDLLWSRALDEPPLAVLRLPRDRVVLVGRTTYVGLAATGEEYWRKQLAKKTISGAAALASSVYLGTDDRGGPGLVRLNSNGDLDWDARPSGEGSVTPRVAHGSLWVSRRGGALLQYDDAGRLVTELRPQDRDPALSPEHPAPLQIAGRLGLLRAARLYVVDLDSGRALAALEGTELAPHSAALLPSGRLTVVGSDGVVEGWAPTGYLRIPSGGRPEARDRAADERAREQP